MHSDMFTVSLSDAVALTGASPAQLRGYVKGGLLDCLLRRGGSEREWFTPDQLVELKNLLDGKVDAEREQRRVVDVVDGLRAYLAELPPLADYDQAIAQRAPVLARSRSGRLHAHVQAAALADWIARNRKDLPTASFELTVAKSLESIGAVRVRGISPLGGGGKQRWQYWFRLPLHTWAASPELESLLYSLTGAREDGEHVTRRRGGPAVLTEQEIGGNADVRS